MKRFIRDFVLNNFILRELFFFVRQCKTNKRKIDNRVKLLFDGKTAVPKNHIKDLIVSLTSYGDRLQELHYTLYSLVVQSIQPEKIIVNIAECDKEKISPFLRQFERFGVEFFITEDLKSYKKFIPTYLRYPDKNIVTADDDLYYGKFWLERLWKSHLNNPNDIVCHLVYTICFADSSLLPYQKWNHNPHKTGKAFVNFVLTGAGALYPPNCLFPDVKNTELFSRLSPYADDIWFYFMSFLNNTLSIRVKHPYNKLRYVNVYREYGIICGQTLTQKNVGTGKNDEQFKAIMKYYKISERNFVNKLKEV